MPEPLTRSAAMAALDKAADRLEDDGDDDRTVAVLHAIYEFFEVSMNESFPVDVPAVEGEE